MAQDKKKPKWGKPKLIILTRGKPEERVLGGCKVAGDPAGNAFLEDECSYTSGNSCFSCSSTVHS